MRIQYVINLKMFVIRAAKYLSKASSIFVLSFSDFGIIKHLLDRASPNIRFVVQIKADVGLSFASSNIILDLHNKSNVRLGAVQQVYNIAYLNYGIKSFPSKCELIFLVFYKTYDCLQSFHVEQARAFSDSKLIFGMLH